MGGPAEKIIVSIVDADGTSLSHKPISLKPEPPKTCAAIIENIATGYGSGLLLDEDGDLVMRTEQVQAGKYEYRVTGWANQAGAPAPAAGEVAELKRRLQLVQDDPRAAKAETSAAKAESSAAQAMAMATAAVMEVNKLRMTVTTFADVGAAVASSAKRKEPQQLLPAMRHEPRLLELLQDVDSLRDKWAAAQSEDELQDLAYAVFKVLVDFDKYCVLDTHKKDYYLCPIAKIDLAL